MTLWSAAFQAVLHCLPELVQINIHEGSFAIHLPLSSTSLSALNLSDHQSISHKIHSFMYQANKILWLQLHQQNFQWIVSVDFLKYWLVWSSWCPRDSLESSPAPPFKSIISLVLSLLYSPILTSIHDYWKNHSFDYMDLCQQSIINNIYINLTWFYKTMK